MRTLIKGSEKTAIAYKENRITYNQVLQNIEDYTGLITKKTGSRVIIYSENRPEYIYSLYAIWGGGSIAVPVDHLSTPDELNYIIKDCKPVTIFTSEECLPNVKKALKGINRKTDIHVFGRMKVKPGKGVLKSIDVDDIHKTSLLIYTSGTTGSPKGVMLSYENILFNIDAVAEAGYYRESETVLVLLPAHHILPLLGTIIAPLLVHATIAISPSLVTDDILSTLCENRVTLMVGVPRLYEAIGKGIMNQINARAITRGIFRLAGALDSVRFSRKIFGAVHKKFGGHVNYLVSGGAALDPEIGRAFKTLGFYVAEGYGMTETAPMITFPKQTNIKLGTTGQPLDGTEVKIVNGEICVRGRNVMQGYYNRPEETAQVIKGGWLHTGDLGVFDSENYLTITGRKKEIIVLPNGKNINPAEIEEKLMKQSNLVQEAAVFMKENKLQVIMKFNKSELTSDLAMEQKLAFDLVTKYNRSVSPYKKIMKFNITHDELPKTRLGKLRRHELAAIETARERKSVKAPNYREYAIIRDYLENETGASIRPDDHFEFDLGLDSLSKVSLIVFLERTFGIKLKDDHLSNYNSLLKLSGYVREKKVKLQESIVNWADILKEKVNVKLPKSWFTTELFKYTGKGLFKVLFNVSGKGMKKLPDSPFIIAPNHQSFFDGMFVAIFLRRWLLKNTFFYAKSTHINNGFLKFLARVNNVIIVDLNNDLIGSIQKLAEVLKKGKNIIIFPEGTRTVDGSLGEFKQTFAILSRELQVPVVPVAIKGAYNVLPKGRRLPRIFKKVSVDFLEPVYPGKKSYYQIIENVRGSIGKELGAE